MKKLFIILLFCISTGCAQHNYQKHSEFDNSDKSITVDEGSSGLNGAIKNILRKNGWTLSVNGSAEVTDGTLGEKTHLTKYDSFNTRYRLYVGYNNYYGHCLFGLGDEVNYEISIIDNKQGTEVVTIDGQGCEGLVIDKIKENLKLNG